jgi:hypothetical protein
VGGYGFYPVMEVILDSEVDRILRAKWWPVVGILPPGGRSPF